MRLVAVADLSAEQVARAREIYVGGFPEDSFARFEDLVEDPCFGFVDGSGDEERVVGWAVLRPLADTGWIFVRYFVAGARGQGIGSRMWRAMRAHFADYSRILLDVEDPEEPGLDAQEESIRHRRIVFYSRVGVEVLPLRSYRPPHDGHEKPMQLLSSDVSAPLAPDEVRRIALAVYEHRYDVTPADAVVRRTLAESGLA